MGLKDVCFCMNATRRRRNKRRERERERERDLGPPFWIISPETSLTLFHERVGSSSSSRAALFYYHCLFFFFVLFCFVFYISLSFFFFCFSLSDIHTRWPSEFSRKLPFVRCCIHMFHVFFFLFFFSPFICRTFPHFRGGPEPGNRDAHAPRRLCRFRRDLVSCHRRLIFLLISAAAIHGPHFVLFGSFDSV